MLGEAELKDLAGKALSMSQAEQTEVAVFSPLLVQYAKTIAQDKVMFGSDYPVISPERWLSDFDALGFEEPVRQKILIDNARRVLKLEDVA